MNQCNQILGLYIRSKEFFQAGVILETQRKPIIVTFEGVTGSQSSSKDTSLVDATQGHGFEKEGEGEL
jgi:hypothetical protein